MTAPLTPVTPTKAEQTLIDTIRLEIEQGKQRALNAMEQEKKKTYWTIGRHIKTHLLLNKKRAEYGEYLFKLLVENIGMNRTGLYLAVQFYEEYPEIVPSTGQLTWTHYTLLLAVPKKAARQALEAKVVKNNLSVSELKDLVRQADTSGAATSPPVLDVTRDAPYVYQLKKVQGKDRIDLGFNIFLKHTPSSMKGATHVQLGAVPHYTYKAMVVEIVDGDTVWVDIDLGFDTLTTQKLRLRGVNSAEFVTPEGKTAKNYIEAQLAGCKFIAIKTYWRDKFTRYLADIFYDKNEPDLNHLIANGKFLNQELLNKGYAVAY